MVGQSGQRSTLDRSDKRIGISRPQRTAVWWGAVHNQPDHAGALSVSLATSPEMFDYSADRNARRGERRRRVPEGDGTVHRAVARVLRGLARSRRGRRSGEKVWRLAAGTNRGGLLADRRQ